jgi:hypothetical protein
MSTSDLELLNYFAQIQQLIENVHETLLVQQFLKKHEKDLKKLCSMKDPVNGSTLLHFSASANNYEIMILLIEAGTKKLKKI